MSHDPARREELRERGANGAAAHARARATGRVARNRIDLSDLPAIRDFVARHAHVLVYGTEPATDRAALVGAAMKIVDKAKGLLDLSELEKQNAELREQLAKVVPETRRALKILPMPGRGA